MLQKWIMVAVARNNKTGKCFYREILECGHYFDPKSQSNIGGSKRRNCLKCDMGIAREISEEILANENHQR